MFICEKTNMILVFAALFAVAVEARRVNAVTNDTINFVEGLAVGLETEVRLFYFILSILFWLF